MDEHGSSSPRRRLPRLAGYLLAALIGAAVATWVATAVGAGGKESTVQTSVTDGVPIESVHPTGVGLPLVGAHGTVGAGDYASSLKAYHDSGAYQRDLRLTDSAAQRFLRQRLEARSKRARKCKRGAGATAARVSCPKGEPAIVLDIDDTSLSNYSFLSATNFSATVAALAGAIAAADTPAIKPTLKLFDWARRRDVAVFFITGRPGGIPFIREQTIKNLTSAGYQDWQELHLNDTGLPTKQYKSGTRKAIEKQGYRILLNVGDQESDLSGGYALRGFKLPNPFYFIGDE